MKEFKNNQVKCSSLDEVKSAIVGFDKDDYIYVIKSRDEYFVENNSPFIRSWETVLYKGRPVKVLEKIEKHSGT